MSLAAPRSDPRVHDDQCEGHAARMDRLADQRRRINIVAGLQLTVNPE
jgi:hypothetical protein